MKKYISDELEGELIRIRRTLHSFAEVGFELEKTKKTVTDELEKLGLEVKTCGNGCIYTVIQGSKEGKTLLLRADMDALPIKEGTDLEFASKNGNMHACGHDMHTAMLIGCAKILVNARDELGGSVKLMFQPAEELLLGCADAVNAGILEDPKPDTAVFLHVLTNTRIKTGTAIISGAGICAPAAVYFEITVLGRSAHASQVGEAVDALSVGAHIAVAIDSISARELNSIGDCIITLGQMSAGTCPNVISDKCVISGTIRSYDQKTIEYVFKRIMSIAEHTAKAHKASAVTLLKGGAPTLLSNPWLSKTVFSALSKHIGKDNVIDGEALARQSAARGGRIAQGSEDFALISHKIPTVMIGLCAGYAEDGYSYPLHNPKTAFDEKALIVGAKCYAATALELLKDAHDG